MGGGCWVGVCFSEMTNDELRALQVFEQQHIRRMMQH